MGLIQLFDGLRREKLSSTEEKEILPPGCLQTHTCNINLPWSLTYCLLAQLSCYKPTDAFTEPESVSLGLLHPSYDYPGGSVVKNPPTTAGDVGSFSGSGRSPGKENGNTLQYSCLGNPMDRGAWWATVHRVARLDIKTIPLPQD